MGKNLAYDETQLHRQKQLKELKVKSTPVEKPAIVFTNILTISWKWLKTH